jgi:hypothetical protein
MVDRRARIRSLNAKYLVVIEVLATALEVVSPGPETAVRTWDATEEQKTTNAAGERLKYSGVAFAPHPWFWPETTDRPVLP